MTSALFEAVGPERRAIDSGVLNAGRQMGSVVGTAPFCESLDVRAALVAGLRHALSFSMFRDCSVKSIS